MVPAPSIFVGLAREKEQRRLAAQAALSQFSIADHYDVMVQLDRDVHDDEKLSTTEVDTALRLMSGVPRSVFLPCFGTGRHIQALLTAGVQRIVGVDLSPKCVEKARALCGGDHRVELHVGDLCTWTTTEQFDASILLGYSFGDIINSEIFPKVTQGMVRPLKPGGLFVFDYIGRGYLDRCRRASTTVWQAILDGRPVEDRRTPRYDPETWVMTIDVEAVAREHGADNVLWRGFYQKLILNDYWLDCHFTRAGIALRKAGVATKVNEAYYQGHVGELGMIARSTWWVAHKPPERQPRPWRLPRWLQWLRGPQGG